MTSDVAKHAEYERAFREHRRHLYGLCYRLTGSAADAEDLVQATFERALIRPPRRFDVPLKPWLVRVAMNLGRDHLRKRKRKSYIGPWLPAPIETGEEVSPPGIEVELAGGETTEARYDLLESMSFAFLLALEALTPTQRAVLLLRDVFDYSGRETADALGISEASVRTTHHRARKAMESYHGRRTIPTAVRQAQAMQTLSEFLGHLAGGDVAAIEALLADDVRMLSDGGGEFVAALKPVQGRKNVIAFFMKLNAKAGPPLNAEVRMLNGFPALILSYAQKPPRQSTRFIIRFDLDDEGKIREGHSVLATRKLSAIAQLFAQPGTT